VAGSSSWKVRLLGVLMVLTWSTCFIAIRGTTEAAPPLLYASLRALVAAAALISLATISHRLIPPRDAWLGLLLLAATSTTLGLAGMFLSVRLAGAALSSVLANGQALLVAPAAAWLFGEKLSIWHLLGIGIGFVGVTVVFVGSGPGITSAHHQGLVLGLLTACGLAAGNLLMKRMAPRVNALTAVTWQYTLGAIFLLAWSVVAEGPPHVTWSPRLVLGILYLGLVASAGASWIWYRLLARDALIPLNGLTLLSPLFSVTLAWLLFREDISRGTSIGIVLALVGVALVSMPRQRPASVRLDRPA